jgi:hypothetical protein
MYYRNEYIFDAHETFLDLCENVNLPVATEPMRFECNDVPSFVKELPNTETTALEFVSYNLNSI